MVRILSIPLEAMRGCCRGAPLVVMLASLASEAQSQPCASGWEVYPDFQTNTVHAVYEYDGVLYRGGWFSLFRWDGTQWQTFGGGIGGDEGTLFVSDFRPYDGALVLGGHFPTAGGQVVHSVATWDGVAFGAVGGGVDGEVDALVTFDGDLIVGGRFSHAGGVEARNIARWDGSAWHPLGSGVFDAIPDGTTDGVWDMAVWQGDLYVVGDFTHAGDVPVSYVGRWDGSTWSDVDGGISMVDGGPTGLRGVDVYDDRLVIVGALDFAGGVEATNIAAWDGTSWSPVGSGSDPYGGPLGLRQAALSVASYGGLLYVGADFTRAVNPNAKALAVWNGQTWRPVDHGLENNDGLFGVPTVRDLEACAGSLLLGGDFDEADHEPTDNVARYTDCDGVTDVAVAYPAGEPLQLRLSPNPATSTFHYTIRLDNPSNVRAALFDVGGRRVRTLLERKLPAGSHRFRHDFGEQEARIGGVFFLRVETDTRVVTRRVVLIP